MRRMCTVHYGHEHEFRIGKPKLANVLNSRSYTIGDTTRATGHISIFRPEYLPTCRLRQDKWMLQRHNVGVQEARCSDNTLGENESCS